MPSGWLKVRPEYMRVKLTCGIAPELELLLEDEELELLLEDEDEDEELELLLELLLEEELLLEVPDEELLRSEEHTSELQSLMRISYAVFCLKKKINKFY